MARQKLLTKKQKQTLPKLYETDGQGDNAKAIVHLFVPSRNFDWFLTEYDQETNTAFGLTINNGQAELGYIYLDELDAINDRHFNSPVKSFRKIGTDTYVTEAIWVERDLYYDPQKLADIKKERTW